MGIFTDLRQQRQLNDVVEHSGSLESRVQRLERELERTRELLNQAMLRLERHLDNDVNGDGRVG